jgi:hypothetical protein
MQGVADLGMEISYKAAQKENSRWYVARILTEKVVEAVLLKKASGKVSPSASPNRQATTTNKNTNAATSNTATATNNKSGSA